MARRSCLTLFLVMLLAWQQVDAFPWPFAPQDQAHRLRQTVGAKRKTTFPLHFHDGLDLAPQSTTVRKSQPRTQSYSRRWKSSHATEMSLVPGR